MAGIYQSVTELIGRTPLLGSKESGERTESPGKSAGEAGIL